MNPRDKIFEMLRRFETVMLVTVGQDGRLDARPMQLADIDDRTGNIWFFTLRDSRKVQEVTGNAEVAVVCQDERSQYLAISGTGLVVHEPARVRELWREPYRVWFSGGPDDPDLRLLAVEPRSAEYWDNTGAKGLEYLFEAARAYVSGDRPRVDEPERHGRVSL